VRPGDVVVDAGGCFGDTALYFAGRVGTTGRVYTFEFSPGNLEVLEPNLARNPALGDRVKVVKAALFDRSSTLSFEDHGRLSRLVPSGDRARQVPALTLDDWARETGLTRVDMVKMDIEGAEPAALRGAREILKHYRPNLAIAAYHAEDDLVTLPRFIASLGLGYRMFLGHYSAGADETVLFATARVGSGSGGPGTGRAAA
jgi:FkbM family methyltransferase